MSSGVPCGAEVPHPCLRPKTAERVSGVCQKGVERLLSWALKCLRHLGDFRLRSSHRPTPLARRRGSSVCAGQADRLFKVIALCRKEATSSAPHARLKKAPLADAANQGSLSDSPVIESRFRLGGAK